MISAISRSTSRPRVVIVEDSKTMQAVLDQIFAFRMGFDVVGVANDATSAATLIRSLRPDLVTIDLCMPYIDGSKLLEMVADVPDVCKIVVSGQVAANPAMSRRLHDAGADACIDKRDLARDPTTFCAAITKALAVFGRKQAPRLLAVPDSRVNGSFGSLSACKYPVPLDEQARLAVLLDSGLTDDRHDARLDSLTTHMGDISGFPTCLMTFIDRDIQWIKSAYGFERGSTPREVAFCNYTLCSDGPFVVSNAATDPRFSSNIFVTDDPRIRTYIGSPIISPAGVKLGALCLLDTKPRKVTPATISSLSSASVIAAKLIEGRSPKLALAA